MIDLSRLDYAFPHFNKTTLPAIPAHWVDVSWHNDESPSFFTDGVQVFVTDGEFRFVIMYFLDGETLHMTNDWEDCLAFVNATTNGDYIVDLLNEDRSVGDCVPAFFPNLESAAEAARRVLGEHRKARKDGIKTQFDGWVYGYSIRNPKDKVVQSYISDI